MNTKLLQNIMLLLAVLVICLIVFEIILRLASERGTFYVEDAKIDWKLKPGLSGTYRSSEFNVAYSFNKEGFNDVDHELAKGNKLRIAVLGDSFVEGLQVPLEKKFSKQLESLLQKQWHDVEVLDFGLSSTSTAQQYLVLQEYALKYKPDLVILSFFAGNDLAENDPQFDYNTGFLPAYKTYAVKNESERSKRSGLVFQRINMREHENWRLKLSRSCYSCTFIYTRMQNLIHNSGAKEPLPRNYYVFTNSTLFDHSWNITAKILQLMHQDLKQHDIPLMIVSIPARFQVENEGLQTHYNVPDDLTLDLAAADTKFLSICKAEHISCIFLQSSFREYSQKNNLSLYFPIDGHFIVKGHALEAILAEKFIIDHQLLSSHE